MSPARLVQKARAGDAGAFRDLYTRFAPLVHAVALGVVGKADAEDVTQDVFLGAWRNLDQLRDPDRCGPWLASMARNRARRLTGASQTERRAAPAELEGLASPAQESQPVGLTTEGLLEHLRAIPEAYREALSLRLIEGRSGPQIASLLGRPEGSVRVHLSRGMEHLRARLRRGSEEL